MQTFRKPSIRILEFFSPDKVCFEAPSAVGASDQSSISDACIGCICEARCGQNFNDSSKKAKQFYLKNYNFLCCKNDLAFWHHIHQIYMNLALAATCPSAASTVATSAAPSFSQGDSHFFIGSSVLCMHLVLL